MDRQQKDDGGQLWRAFDKEGLAGFLITRGRDDLSPVGWVDELLDVPIPQPIVTAWNLRTDFSRATADNVLDLRGKPLPWWMGGMTLQAADPWGRPIPAVVVVLPDFPHPDETGGPAGGGVANNKKGRTTAPNDPTKLGGEWVERSYAVPAFAC